MPRLKDSLTRLGAVWVLGLLLVATGCRIDVVRSRAGNELNEAEFEKLEEKKTTRADVLERLGVPLELKYRPRLEEEHFFYLYRDTIDTALRFQLPFSTLFGYQHTFLRLSERSSEVNSMFLIFDEDGVLKQKSLRLSEAYQKRREEGPSSKLHLAPHISYSGLLNGSAGTVNYGEAFQNGFRAGLHVGYQPVPVVTLLAGGNYQLYGGSSTTNNGARLSFDDLELFQFDIGIRLEAPLSLLFTFPDFETVKEVLFEENLDKPKGWILYVQGTTGGTMNQSVQLEINGAASGNFYDSGVGFSAAAETGVAYDWEWGNVHLGILFQSVDPFDQGNSPVDDSGSAFQAFMITGGARLKF